jgi:hypothetical protein
MSDEAVEAGQSKIFGLSGKGLTDLESFGYRVLESRIR